MGGDHIPGCSPVPLSRLSGACPAINTNKGKLTVGDGGYETVYRGGAVEEHAGRHSLLPHEVAVCNIGIIHAS